MKRLGYIKKFNAAYATMRQYIDTNFVYRDCDHPIPHERYTYADENGKRVDVYALRQNQPVEKYSKWLLDDVIAELKTVTEVGDFEKIKRSFIPMTSTCDKTLIFRAILIHEDRFNKTKV